MHGLELVQCSPCRDLQVYYLNDDAYAAFLETRIT